MIFIMIFAWKILISYTLDDLKMNSDSYEVIQLVRTHQNGKNFTLPPPIARTCTLAKTPIAYILLPL